LEKKVKTPYKRIWHGHIPQWVIVISFITQTNKSVQAYIFCSILGENKDLMVF